MSHSSMKLTLITILSLLLFNCTNITQFIDVDDMLTVKAGLSKEQLKTNIGKPTMVRAGIKLRNNDVHEIWVYKVRKNLTKQVLDYNRLLPAFIVPGMKPKKDFKGNGWSGRQMYGFMFKNNKLYKWGFLGDDWVDFEEVDGEFLGPDNSNNSSGGGVSASGGFLSKIPIIGRFL